MKRRPASVPAEKKVATPRLPADVKLAIATAQDKLAVDLTVLDLRNATAFTDFFIVCTGTSSRHSQSIADSIEEKLKRHGVRPLHIEGRGEADWILMDYVDFVVHIFSARAREFYDLERLWRTGKRRDIHELIGQPT